MRQNSSLLLKFIFSLAVLSIAPAAIVGAAPITDFKAGRIIEDSVFTNSESMGVQQIQSFLNSRVPSCDTWGTQPSEFGGGTRAQWGTSRGTPPPYVCLKDYSENGRSAAQIIYDVTQEFTINPQVFIVLLQKEQALITDTWPLPVQYRTATGYGCPDTAPCDSQYYGLTNQLRWSGRMFRAILNNSPTWYTPYILGNNFIRWSPNAACGGSNVNIENRSTQALYNYTPYQPNQAALNAGYGTGDACSAYGNRNFYLYFKDWFGYNAGPVAFRPSNSQTIYLNVNGYKLQVPYMAALHDYGISAEAIQTVSPSYADSIPNPPDNSGISTSISHVVKSPRDDDEDGGTIYLITLNKRFQFETMQQFFDYGFKESDISYLPLSYILQKQSGSTLPNFLTSPTGSVFKLESGKKRLLFEYSTYRSHNPSDRAAALSYYLVDKIPLGSPIVDRPVLIKPSSGESVFLYSGSNYYKIPNYDTLKCWGFETTLRTPVYRLPFDAYADSIPPAAEQLSCLNIVNGQGYALISGKRMVISPQRTPGGLSPAPQELTDFYLSQPLARSLSKYLKTSSSAAVWVIDGDKRRVIPTYNTFLSMGLLDINIDVVSDTILNAYINDGIYLHPGQLVKARDSAAVYIIGADGKRHGFSSSDLFLSYGLTFDKVESLEASGLSNYPSANPMSTYLTSPQQPSVRMMATNGCYVMDESLLAHFGTSESAIIDAQGYANSLFPSRLTADCSPGTQYVRPSNSSLVYKVINGKKHPITTYAKLVESNGGKEPLVPAVDPLYVASIALGSTLQ